MPGLQIVVVAAALGLAGAAEAADTPSAPPACNVVDAHHGAAVPAALFFVCGNVAYRLGEAAQYSSSYNAALAATIVVRRNSGRTDVSLVTIGANGMPRIGDLNREVGKLAAGAGISLSAPLAVDVSTFAVTGKIGLSARNGPSAATFDVSRYATITPVLVTPQSATSAQ